MRVEAILLARTLWERLDTFQIHYIPLLVDPFLDLIKVGGGHL